jgi:catechol 2,3-dioxygenase-like lactoylglutathione lyase family enzyme
MSETEAVDLRPSVWIGHVALTTDCLSEAYAFMQKLGMRGLMELENIAILELRAGTHLILRETPDHAPGPAPFDLMVEDLEATHAELSARGLAPSEIEGGDIHHSFSVRDPSGHTIKFNSSHASDQPV